MSHGSCSSITSDSSITIGARPPVAITVTVLGSSRQLDGHPPHDAIDLPGEAEQDAGLQRLDGVATDYRAGTRQLDLAQLRPTGTQGLHRDLDPWGDGSPEVLTLGGDGVERGGRSEVDDDGRSAVHRGGR